MRRTKSIPKFVYFNKMYDGWLAGPFVRPQKGKDNIIFKLTEVKTKKDAKTTKVI